MYAKCDCVIGSLFGSGTKLVTFHNIDKTISLMLCGAAICSTLYVVRIVLLG